mgnify:CR=1 FL=1
MEINLLFFASVVPAIVLYGIAKSGLGGSISLISVPLMTVVMPLNQALAIILPILIFSDIIAVYRFRREFDFGTLKLIVPFAAIGIIIGSFTFTYFSEDLLKLIVGIMGFLLTSSRSKKRAFKCVAKCLPTVDFPEPGGPTKKTRMFEPTYE